MKKVENGLLLILGTNVEKVITAFEKAFGIARKQAIPCDNTVQLEHQSQPLNSRDASAYRSIVGLCLSIGREGPDMMFGIKELASRMFSPTFSAVQHLRNLAGYMKHVGDVAVLLTSPVGGDGRCAKNVGSCWVLETYSDADWGFSKSRRHSTSRLRMQSCAS